MNKPYWECRHLKVLEPFQKGVICRKGCFLEKVVPTTYHHFLGEDTGYPSYKEWFINVGQYWAPEEYGKKVIEQLNKDDE